MTATLIELLDLVGRWVHVIAGIMWVGNSMLFNWLDRSLLPPGAQGERSQTPEPTGTIWLLHSGGFYYVEKTLLHGAAMPRPLHWFKWQAYTTWISGAVLLVALYHASDRAVLADPTVSSLSHIEASLVGLGAVAGGWALYELMQRLVAPRLPALALFAWVSGLLAISVSLTQLLSGRAAFLHVGAMLGSIMAGNVAMTIVPSQRELVRSVEQGGQADPAVSARAKRVSIHNNYLTFPVIALMLSGHFSSVVGHRWSWLLLLVLIAAGAGVRHVLNLRWTWPAWRPALAAVMVAGAVALYPLLRMPPSTGPAGGSGAAGLASGSAHAAAPDFRDVERIVTRRCAACHSMQPSDLTFGPAPGGVSFDEPDQVVARASRIHERAVVTRTMPPANRTNMTEEERAVLGRWWDSRPGTADAQLPR